MPLSLFGLYHSQLSYVAALGSQRQKIDDQQVLQLLLDCPANS